MTTFGIDYIWVMVCWFSSFRCYFDLVKQIKRAVSWHFRDKVRAEWAEICHVNLHLVISPEMKKTNFGTLKLSSYRAGGMPDYCVVLTGAWIINYIL